MGLWMRASTAGKKIVLFAALLGAALLSIGFVALATGEKHSVLLNTDNDVFDWRLVGSLEYTYTNPWGSSVTIETNSGPIIVHPGDRVKIVVNALNRGSIWIGLGGFITIEDLPVKAIYVNDALVASNTVIDEANMRYDSSSLASILKLEAILKHGEEQGWAYLAVDGNTVMNQYNYRGYVIVYDIAPGSTSLNLDIENQYLSGTAGGIEWNGNVIGVDELPFLHALLG